MAARRVGKWRANNASVGVARSLVDAGLQAALAAGDRRGYERVLEAAQGSWEVDLSAEPALLSSACVACCGAGLMHHAKATNLSLTAAGLSLTTEACNALMEAQLRRNDNDAVIDTFIHMRKHGPAPDRTSHACATRAAASRKATWSGLRNLMRRNWLKIPWNPHSANAALVAFIRAGNLEAAAGVVSHMEGTLTPLRLEALEALLEWSSSVLDASCTATVVTDIFEAIERHALQAVQPAEEDATDAAMASGSEQPPLPLSAATWLLVVPYLKPRQRFAFLVRAMEQGRLDAADEVVLQAALALLAACDGRGDESAAWVLCLHAEGVDLRGLDRGGILSRMLSRVLARGDGGAATDRRQQQDSNALLEDGAVTREEPRARPHSRAESLWVLAVRACGSDEESAESIISAMEASGELDVAVGKGIDALLEYLRGMHDPNSAVLGLRKMRESAPPEAYVIVLTTCCTDDNPNMAMATATLDAMQEAGALDAASPGQLLRLYVALVTGYGRLYDLDAAHEAFLEGCQWLEQAQQQQLMRGRREDEDASAAGTAVDEDDAVDGDGEPEWGEAQWTAAERALHKVMVEAAAPHPRGLLLACTLLEQLTRNTGEKLKHGYYSQLIAGHATANDLHVALGALQGAQRQGLGASRWRVSDSTIATLMDALNRQAAGLGEDGVAERARDAAMRTLGDAGIAMDRKVAEYLASKPIKQRSKRTVNANDDLVTAERGGLPPPSRVGEYDSGERSARRIEVAGLTGDAEVDESDRDVSDADVRKLQYDEFEKLLAQRDERRPAKKPGDASAPPTERDTRRSVDVRRLNNLGPLNR